MTGAGIMEGDMVVVEKGREPRNGDIVVAEVDGDWTLNTSAGRGSGSSWRLPTRNTRRLHRGTN